MKKNPKETLLHDVLRDASDGFRQEVFEASLKELRQRRGNSKTWLNLPLAIAAGLVLTVGVLFFFGMAQRTMKPHLAQLPGGVQTAHVSSYPPMEIVTNPGLGMEIVESHQYTTSIVENSSIRQPVEMLGDTELLALFPDKPVGLIANSQGTVQLVLLDSQDQIFRQ